MTRARWFSILLCAAGVAAVAAPAAAQYTMLRAPNPATGEKYHFEVSGVFWQPDLSIVISSESIGIPGTDIDFVRDLGILDANFTELRTVLRFARKHKLRFDYLPMKYEADTVLTRTIIFNGIAYTVGIPVEADLEWRTYRFGYEWDMFYRDRWFVGLLLEAKYTDVRAELTAPVIGTEFAEARGPIPSIGVVGRGYVTSNISVTGQFSFFNLPNDIFKIEDYDGDVYDFDICGTVNFTNNVGAQVGYRYIDVGYTAELDTGDLKVKGFYFGGVVRF